MKRFLLLALLALAFPACSGIQANQAAAVASSTAADGTVDQLAVLAKFTVADLAAADADAVANNDEIAHACYPALSKFVQSLQPNVPGSGPQTVAGAFSIFQKKRDLLQSSGGKGSLLPAYLKIGCAALVQDEKVFLAKLALIAAGGAATGGAVLPFAGALPALGGALPIPLQ